MEKHIVQFYSIMPNFRSDRRTRGSLGLAGLCFNSLGQEQLRFLNFEDISHVTFDLNVEKIVCYLDVYKIITMFGDD